MVHEIYIELQKYNQAVDFLEQTIEHLFQTFNQCPYCRKSWTEHVKSLVGGMHFRNRPDKMGCTIVTAIRVLLKLKYGKPGHIRFSEEEIDSMRDFSSVFRGWEFGPEFFGIFFE